MLVNLIQCGHIIHWRRVSGCSNSMALNEIEEKSCSGLIPPLHDDMLIALS